MITCLKCGYNKDDFFEVMENGKTHRVDTIEQAKEIIFSEWDLDGYLILALINGGCLCES